MRLIDADALPKLLDAEYKQTMKLIREGEKHLDTLAEGFAEASHIAKYIASTVDAVPVTRCRDCANFRQNASGACWCDEYGGAITPNDYCSRAVSDKQPRASIPWEAD